MILLPEVLILRSAFLVGYYGYGNFGDEMLMEESIKLLRELGFRRIYTLYPRKIELKDVVTVEKGNIMGVIGAILKSDVVFFGGGGLLQDETSLRSFVFYSAIAILSRMFRKRVVFFGNGFGPVRKRLSKILMRRITRSRKTIFFPRDEVSEGYISRLGGMIREGTDVAIGYLKKFEFGKKTKNAILVPRSERNWEKIASFLERLGLRPKFFLADPSDSRYVDGTSREITMGLGIDELATSSIVVSERFHPALVAAFNDVPFVSIGKKSSRFFRRYIPEYPGILDKATDIDIMLAVQRVIGNPPGIRKDLERDYEEMVERLKKLRM